MNTSIPIIDYTTYPVLQCFSDHYEEGTVKFSFRKSIGYNAPLASNPEHYRLFFSFIAVGIKTALFTYRLYYTDEALMQRMFTDTTFRNRYRRLCHTLPDASVSGSVLFKDGTQLSFLLLKSDETFYLPNNYQRYIACAWHAGVAFRGFEEGYVGLTRIAPINTRVTARKQTGWGDRLYFVWLLLTYLQHSPASELLLPACNKTPEPILRVQ